MNRRDFIAVGAAGIALSGMRVSALQVDAPTTVLVSELTDAEIDFTSSGFELISQSTKEISGSTGVGSLETIDLQSGFGEITIDFSSIGIMDLPLYLAERSQGHQAISGAVEHALETFETGGYLVLSFDTRVSYLEYQLAALPTADMIVSITTEQSSFLDELAKTQTIMVGEAPPYLFLAESGVESVVFDNQETVTTVPSRSSRVTTTQSTTTSTSTTSSAGNDSAYIDAITTHRSAFIASYSEFSDHLATVGADTTTDTDKATLFTQMYDIALTWKQYPTDATALSVPPGLDSLGAIYGQWAGVIGEMGTLFEELYMGIDTIDAFIAAVTEWETLDGELEAELSLQGFADISRAGTALDSIKIGLRATRRAVQ